MWRVLGILERVGETITLTSQQFELVRAAIEEETSRMHRRLHEDAAELREVVTSTTGLNADDAQRLLDVTSRIEATAVQVAGLVHRPADAQEQIEALLRPE